MARSNTRVGFVVVGIALAAVACDSGSGANSASATAETKTSGTAKPAKSAPPSSSAPGATAPKASASAPADDGSVTISKHYAAVGDKETETKNESMTAKANVKTPKGEQAVDTAENEVTEKVEECLEVKEKACSKLKVTFTKAQKHSTTDGKTKDVTKPIEGKTYIVEAKGTEREITLEGGGKPSEGELAEFKNKYKRMNSSKELIDSIPDKVKVGDSLDDLAKKLAEQASEDAEDKPKADVTIKVKEIKEEGGKKLVVLDVHLKLDGESKKIGHMKLDMSGTMHMRADGGYPVSMDFSGPLEILFANDGGKMAGTMTEKTTSTFSW